MDPSNLRAGVAEKLAGGEAIDAETFNAACFMLTRAVDEIEFAVPEAAPLIRRLLRVCGRVAIDMGVESASPEVWPNTREMAIEWIDEALGGLDYEARPKAG
ncbi:MAG TPA: hypothetical protein VFL29_06015 [Candidatus Dormibacteraeota bacterium]|nr:hypothetical protein [Candidatus Dormibacteraeota bacterium]